VVATIKGRKEQSWRGSATVILLETLTHGRAPQASYSSWEATL
jgi:hypothetical protein